MPDFTDWDNFYVIVGSAAGALIGLQFVVMTLISNRPATKRSAEASAAFATPTIIHFSAALLLAASASVHWHGISIISMIWGIVGLIGTIYALVVTWRLRAQTIYQPVFEDWFFHALLPLVAYATLAGAAYTVYSNRGATLMAVGGATLLLLFIGIHNAWDAVTYHVITQAGKSSKSDGNVEK
jgi:hypothetical protein